MDDEIETDYLIVGAGAAGMAIADELLAHTDSTLVIVDRGHAPGGHWLHAYPFVRLHQPSTFYGVSSMPLGNDAVDEVGTNKGFYELAGADELRAYYERVMLQRFLPTGRVRYFPRCDWDGDCSFVSRMTGKEHRVRVDRRLVDATYIEGQVPATTPPPFEVADGVRCVSAGQLAWIHEPPERYVLVGGGKTALDACVFMLERGVAPDAIQWIRPRDARWMNRRFQQPFALLPELYRGAALQMEAMAEATSIAEVFERLEADNFFVRIDPTTPATMLRGAIVSESELALLRQVEDVVRMGHVERIERDEIVLTEGRIPTTPGTLYVHCAASGLSNPPLRPIFEPGRMTVQPIQWSFACYQLAMLGVVEATIESDDDKNRLCRPIHYWDKDVDYLTGFLRTMAVDRGAQAHPTLAKWMRTTRLNPASGLPGCADHPTVLDARTRIKQAAPRAAANLQKLVANR